MQPSMLSYNNFIQLDNDAQYFDEHQQHQQQLHGGPLTFAWCILANLSIIIVQLRWYRNSFYIHLVLMGSIILITFLSTFNKIFHEENEHHDYGDDDDHHEGYYQQIHQIIGKAVVIWIFLQILTGVLARIVHYYVNISPNICYIAKNAHRISGYMITFFAKSNYLTMRLLQQFELSFFVILGFDILCLAFVIQMKFNYISLGEVITDPQIEQQNSKKQDEYDDEHFIRRFVYFIINVYRSVKLIRTQQSVTNQNPLLTQLLDHRKQAFQVFETQQQISLQEYVLFNDYVYNIKPLRQFHPGGQLVIQLTNRRQIDRFLYGNYAVELVPQAHIHSHTKDSLRLCGKPVGKVKRSCPMKGIKRLNKLKIRFSKKFSYKSQVFMLHLETPSLDHPEKNPLRFEGFKHESQLGQHFSLTFTTDQGNTWTRLYSAIWCMRPKNLKFMECNFPSSTKLFSEYTTEKVRAFTKTRQKTYQMQLEQPNKQIIPIIMKNYIHGQLTYNLLLQTKDKEIILSQAMGGGLHYEKLKHRGKVIIICCGTGILPFCDFIDLLFKKMNYEADKNLAKMAENDPLIKQDLLRNRQFYFYCAAFDIEDLPPLTLFQINELCENEQIKFQATFRISVKPKKILQLLKNIQFQDSYFNENLKDHLIEENICKIYVCGSPELNYSIGKILQEKNVDKDLYHLM